MMDFVIVILFVMGAIAILGQKDTLIYTVGPKEVKMLHAYSEGEEYREYLQQAAKFSFLRAAEAAGAKTQNDCIVQLNSQSFQEDLEANFKEYVNAYRAGEDYLGFTAYVGGGFQKPVLGALNYRIYIIISPGQQFAGLISVPLTEQINMRYSIDPIVIIKDLNCDSYSQYVLTGNQVPTRGG
ncbi:MAG: hypothetical protein HY438_02790 [DPANN group archaeon]|nr:hypothetical protein [DPANN group archaeon]